VGRKKLIFSVLFVAAASIPALAQKESSPRRIIFARRAAVARVSGYLRGIHDEAWFVLRVKSGQEMQVEIRGRGPTRGLVVFPSGKQEGGPGGVIFDGETDENGDHRIRVTESMMAEAWRGRFTLTVRVLPIGR